MRKCTEQIQKSTDSGFNFEKLCGRQRTSERKVAMKEVSLLSFNLPISLFCFFLLIYLALRKLTWGPSSWLKCSLRRKSCMFFSAWRSAIRVTEKEEGGSEIGWIVWADGSLHSVISTWRKAISLDWNLIYKIMCFNVAVHKQPIPNMFPVIAFPEAHLTELMRKAANGWVYLWQRWWHFIEAGEIYRYCLSSVSSVS